MKFQPIKNMFKYATLALGMAVSFTACSDDEGGSGPDVPKVLDGVYITGAGTGLTTLSTKGKMSVTRNEVLQEDRTTLFEAYVAVKAGAEGFNIVTVEGATQKTWGPGAGFAELAVAERHQDEPKDGSLQKGAVAEGTTKFTVPTNGLYHVVIDTKLGKAAVAEVKWGLIGGATPGGWGASTEMASTFDLNKMVFSIAEVTLLKNEFKFRYSNGWKIFLDTEEDLGGGKKGVTVNTNFGGDETALVPGGANIANDKYGIYKAEMTWELGKKTVAAVTFVKDGEPLPEYPANMYMIGASIGGWDWAANGVEMIPVHSNPHLFWRIIFIDPTVTDAGVKFAPKKEWAGDFGVSADAAVDGVYKKGGSNLLVPAAGYYMVVVNLKTETIEANAPLIYGIGNAYEGKVWDGSNPAYKFTLVGDEFVSPNFANAGEEVRMHVAASTMKVQDGTKAVDWWQAEFIVLEGKIAYRGTGDDQARVLSQVGKNAKLNFKTGTGSIN